MYPAQAKVMNYQEQKFVRFQDWNSPKSSTSEGKFYTQDNGHTGMFKRTITSVSKCIHESFERGSKRFKSMRRSFHFRSLEDSSTDDLSSRKVLDPQGSFLQRCNKIFLLACVLAVSIDPLFFYIPVVDRDEKCLDLDDNMKITASVLRSFIDILYVLHIFFQFRTGFIAPSSRVFGRGVLVANSVAIAKRYLLSYFLIDILAILPLPQVVVLIITPRMSGSESLNAKNMLRFVVLLQYIPRFVRMYPLYKEVTRNAGNIAEAAWEGAVLNLFLYMLASHILGAFWYLFSIEREDTCWRKACKENNVDTSTLYCGRGSNTIKKDFLDVNCSISENSTQFDFGIFLQALQSEVVETRNFPEKFFYCFWWGLQNLSSLGQNLKTSTFVGEIAFAVFISICGLVLFALLIGNMQTYLQSTTVRLEEMRVKRRDAEQWMAHRLLPEHIRERIRRYEQYKWQETRGVDEEHLITNLPKDLRRDIKRHLCLALVMRVRLYFPRVELL